MYMFLCIAVFISFGYILRSRVSGQIGNPMLNILNNYKQFSKAAHFSFPSAMYEGSNFSTSSTILVILKKKVYFSHCNVQEVMSHNDFDLHFHKI